MASLESPHIAHVAADPSVEDVVLVTCRAWPELSESDVELARALARAGHLVRVRPWNSAPLSDFESADLVVLRSNWDFHHEPDAFADWLDAIDASSAELRNPAGVIRPFLDKSYLGRIAAKGLRAPNTLMLPEFDQDSVTEWLHANELDVAVVKPIVGASGHGVDLVRRGDVAAASERWHSDPRRRPLLVQEFISEVSAGEIALVYFAGEYSHALRRRPSIDDFRVNSQYGGTMSLARDVADDLIEFGADVVQRCVPSSTYARIDVVATRSGPVLMEIEVNEPALGLHLGPGSADRFARALLGPG